MRNITLLGATWLAGVAGTASAHGITFQGFPNSGTYHKVVSINKDGDCPMQPHTFNGANSPLDEELSAIVRGPAKVKQFAVYTQEPSSSRKRSHILGQYPRRRGHRHYHEQIEEFREAKKAQEKRDPVVLVTATIDGSVVTMTDTWNVPGASPTVSIASAATGSSPESIASPVTEPHVDAGSGNWARSAYYEASSATAEGLTFLGNVNWNSETYATLGATLGYVTPNGQNSSSGPTVLEDTLIPDGVEFVISSSNLCNHSDCGATAPGAIAYHGFAGNEKMFMIELEMPLSGQTGYLNADMPAFWLLNTQVVNQQQYAKCSCWATGCGEWDIHEILTAGATTGYASMHMGSNYAGQAPTGLARPVSGTMKIAAIVSGGLAHVEVLDPSTAFATSISGSTVSDYLNNPNAVKFDVLIALSSNPSTSSSSAIHPHIASATTSSAQPPTLPAKPSTLNSVVNQTASNYSPYGGAARYGSTPYGGMGSYSSPYSRFGGMGNSMYGGGYGSMYGGMGGMGGMYGGGMGGFPGQPGMAGGDPNSLTNSFSQSTQATFQIIESIVGAFGGFAQMLESTYMATHSSFFAMISVAEQFSNLRDTLGSILGIFTLLRWARTLLAKITGRAPPADATALTPSAFAAFQGLPRTLPDGSPAPPRPSKKPFLFFILAAFGLPYLMGKLIRALARSQDEAAARQQGLLLGPDGTPLPLEQQNQALDPSQLDFCRLLYDYVPDATGAHATPGIDLEVKKGDLVAVLSKADPVGNPSEWWRCRARDGRVGYLPSPYLEIIQRRPKEIGAGSPQGSRAHTMTTEGEASRAGSMKVGVEAKAPRVDGKVGDISAESFQKSQFYS
ncbi:Peroxisomal membrane protein PAS20 [Lambiella insularis]|nr:Peroxisomal membrane protein PAS20 [Lambiella insularis]